MATIIKVDGREDVICQALTFGYMYDLETGVKEENTLDAIMDGADLSEDDVRSLRRPDVGKIFGAIKKETYPELYDENGDEKEIEDDDEDDDKKKV